MRKASSVTCNNISFLFASYKKCIELAVLAFKTISVLSWAFDVACLIVQLMNLAQRFTKEPTYRKTAKTVTLNSNILTHLRVEHWPKMCRMGQDGSRLVLISHSGLSNVEQVCSVCTQDNYLTHNHICLSHSVYFFKCLQLCYSSS